LVMHESWNKRAIPDELISVEKTMPIL